MSDQAIASRSGPPAPLPIASRPRYRVAAIFQRPIPHLCKFFQCLAARAEIDLKVYFFSDVGIGSTRDQVFLGDMKWDTDLLSGYQHRFFRNYSSWPGMQRITGLLRPSLLRELNREYDAVWVHGWGPTTYLPLVTSFARRIPVLLYSDKNVNEKEGWWRHNFHNLLLPKLFPRVAAFLVIGQRNAVFYRSLGVPEEKMFLTPLAVDNAFFRQEACRLQPKREALRQKYGIPLKATVILYVGRLSPEKGVLDLLPAFAELSGDSAHLILVGDGPQRAALETYVGSHKLQRIHFAGFQNYSQVPSFYALSDVFVLPSRAEAWGVVINQAMNFGLPIVASQVGGAIADLVENGRNGLLFEPGDVAQLAGHLSRLIEDPELRRQMGEESARRIAVCDFERGVEGVLAALRTVIPTREMSGIAR